MIDNYMIFSFLLMALIFIRQISIYKKPNKINYAPLMLGIGALSSVIHFIISPDTQPLILTMKGSMIPFLVSLMLYIVMNIMHQSQMAENEQIRMEFTKALIKQITDLKNFTQSLENRKLNYANEERDLRNEFSQKLNQDIETLSKLLQNQKTFMQNWEEIKKWHQELNEQFINFTEFKLPELDSIIHKHIDMLRISEAEHYKKLTVYLEETIGKKENIIDAIKELDDEIVNIKNLSSLIAQEIITKSLKEIKRISTDFEGKLNELSLHTESLKTTLSESENKIDNVKNLSSIVIEQMVIISKKLEEFENKKEHFDELISKITPVLNDLESLKKQYKDSDKALNLAIDDMKQIQYDNLKELSNEVHKLVEDVKEKVDSSIDELKRQYHLSDDVITQSVKILAKKTQLKNPYENQED